jgi:hypothetical protein
MPSRIEVELTSARPDGTWTWRVAGAREPKGIVESAVLPEGAKVGDVFRVEATIALDGIEIHSVVPERAHRREPDRLEILGGGDFQAVTTSLVGRRDRDSRGPGDRRERRDRRDRKDGDRRSGGEGRPRREGAGSDGRRPRGDGAEGGQRSERERRPPRERPTYAPVPEVPQRPKPKRLKPGRAHRQALMASLPEERQAVAEQLFRAGLPGVRQALKDQNAALAAEGKPQITTSGIESLAQDLLPAVRVAEWLDRADAALAVVDELDLRDLRSVVTAAADPVVARDDSTRELADRLRAALERRQNEEHDQWLVDITVALDVGRVVRALRLSSRPPKAGVPFPSELATRLAEATTGALTPDAASDRWAAVVEALAFSPVHAIVTPPAPPQVVSDDLKAMVKGVASAVPQIAVLVGVEVPPPGSRPPRAPRLPRRPAKPKAKAQAPAKGSGERGPRRERPEEAAVEKKPSAPVADEAAVVDETPSPAEPDAATATEEIAARDEPPTTDGAPAADEAAAVDAPAAAEEPTPEPAPGVEEPGEPAAPTAAEESTPEPAPVAEEPGAAEAPAAADERAPEPAPGADEPHAVEEPAPAEERTPAEEPARSEEPAPVAEEPSAPEAGDAD